MNKRIYIISFLALLLSSFYSANFTEITWQDLIPHSEEIVDPFKELSPEVLEDLKSLVRLRNKMGTTPSESNLSREKEIEDKLSKGGIDYDKLLDQRLQIIESRYEASIATVQKLNGKSVSISGFMLPLEIMNNETSEFLLVPWVGACIHTPPPAGNQIVYVKLKEPLKISGLYDAVSVKGKLIIQSNNKELFLKDGNGSIGSSYTIIPEELEKLDLSK